MNEREEREEPDWQQSQHADRLQLERAACEVLIEYMKGRTSAEGLEILLQATGIPATRVLQRIASKPTT